MVNLGSQLVPEIWTLKSNEKLRTLRFLRDSAVCKNECQSQKYWSATTSKILEAEFCSLMISSEHLEVTGRYDQTIPVLLEAQDPELQGLVVQFVSLLQTDFRVIFS